VNQRREEIYGGEGAVDCLMDIVVIIIVVIVVVVITTTTTICLISNVN
jgi:hypothetical protein